MTKLRFPSYPHACGAVWYVLNQGSNQPSGFTVFMIDIIFMQQAALSKRWFNFE